MVDWLIELLNERICRCIHTYNVWKYAMYADMLYGILLHVNTVVFMHWWLVF